MKVVKSKGTVPSSRQRKLRASTSDRMAGLRSEVSRGGYELSHS